MAEFDKGDGFDGQLDGLDTALGDVAALTAGFEAALRGLRGAMVETQTDIGTLERGLSRGLRRAFDGLLLDGLKLSDALENVARSMIATSYSAAVRPVTAHLGQALIDGVGSVFGAVLPFAQGAGFTQGRVMPFAKGGVVSGPSLFAMRGGTGLMGEAGPEAIMPLARGPDGALGIRMQGGGRPVNVVMNITTPDVEGFRRSQSQLAGQMARALGRGQRNG